MEKVNLPFGQKNYRYMIIGLVTLCIGFIVMSLDTEKHGFGVLGLTLGPIIVLLGFAIQFFAILHNPKKEKINLDK